MELKDQLDHARALFRAQQFDEALAQYLDLWTSIPSRAPELGAVRVSFLASYIRELAAVHPPTRERFIHLRNAAGTLASTSNEVLCTARFDWVVLNEIIGDARALLDWFAEVEHRMHQLTDAQLRQLTQRLAPVLIQQGAWVQLGRLRRDPLSELRVCHDVKRSSLERNARLSDLVRREADQEMARLFRRQTLDLYRSLLACGRHDEATALAEEAVRLEDDAKLKADLAACAASMSGSAS